MFYKNIDHMTWNGCKQTQADFVYYLQSDIKVNERSKMVICACFCSLAKQCPCTNLLNLYAALELAIYPYQQTLSHVIAAKTSTPDLI